MLNDGRLGPPDTSGMSGDELHQYYLEVTSRDPEPAGDELLNTEGTLTERARPAAYMDEMHAEMGLELVCSPQALVDVLRRHPAPKEEGSG